MSLEDKLVTLDEKYQALASLELELMDIRRRGNIIAYEKTVKIASTETLSQETIDSLRKEFENRKDDLRGVYKAAQPVTSDISHLYHKLESAEKFVEAVHDKYSSCLKDKSVHKLLQRLQNAIKLASLKVKELEENVQDGDIEEDDQRRTIARKSFQESLPYSKEIGTTRAEVKGLKASQPGEKVPIGHPDASNSKLPANNGNNGVKDYSFL